NDTLRQKWNGTALIAHVPVGVPNPNVPLRTFKSDVWRRCTDSEANALDAALAAAPARLRRLWADSTILERDSAEWPELLAGVVAVVGATRAAQLLAPSA